MSGYCCWSSEYCHGQKPLLLSMHVPRHSVIFSNYIYNPCHLHHHPSSPAVITFPSGFCCHWSSCFYPTFSPQESLNTKSNPFEYDTPLFETFPWLPLPVLLHSEYKTTFWHWSKVPYVLGPPFLTSFPATILTSHALATLLSLRPLPWFLHLAALFFVQIYG